MSTPVPTALRALVDDARALLDTRVPRVAGAPWDGPGAAVLRALVLPETVLGSLADDVPPVPVVLRITAGAGAVGPALVHADRVSGLRLAGIATGVRADDDPAANAERLVRALDGALPDGVPASIALPSTDGTPGRRWLDAVDVVAAAEHAVAVRASGDPAVTEAAVGAALDRECRVLLVGDPTAAETIAALRAADGDVDDVDRRWLLAAETSRPAALVADLLGSAG